ncbi:HAUS augmin-like complex subunit 3 [Portunus trituberculatus]|uniref:HAUS augmin-like complex subunit 3 n=1 Tax=Portunus trituberculatus TaxID=210409 RepID=A0A5B7F222_PORTR|nr:HAUS augmin-like complex subunit 3 [Portunus trituberculatus]
MNGEQLVKHLQALGAPGTEHLVGEAYDWLFVKGKDDPLVTFLQWFMKNITPNNVLTEEELTDFEALKAAGEVLSPTQLQEMEGALSSIPSFPGASEQCLGEPLPSPEELKALEDELEILTQRKNMINAHKMELLNETQQLSKRMQKTQSELRRQVEATSTTSFHFTKAQQNLASVVDAHLNTFHNFDQAEEEEAMFLSQVDLEEWQKEEDKFTNLLTTYIQKQFREVCTEDCSQYVLLDVNNLELSLVRGAGEDQYRRNVAELRRLNALLPQTEEWRLCGLIQQERRKAEVMEAEKLLAALHQGHLPSDLIVLKQQTQEVEESLTVVEKEFWHQQQTMQAVLSEVAELESTKTISGDYELKLQRQGYFLTKQMMVC